MAKKAGYTVGGIASVDQRRLDVTVGAVEGLDEFKLITSRKASPL